MLFFPRAGMQPREFASHPFRDNLRQLYMAQAQFSNSNGGYSPPFHSPGTWRRRSSCPKLHDKQFFQDSRLVICPASPLAHDGNFQIPSVKDVQASSAQSLSNCGG